MAKSDPVIRSLRAVQAQSEGIGCDLMALRLLVQHLWATVLHMDGDPVGKFEVLRQSALDNAERVKLGADGPLEREIRDRVRQAMEMLLNEIEPAVKGAPPE